MEQGQKANRSYIISKVSPPVESCIDSSEVDTALDDIGTLRGTPDRQPSTL